MRNFLFLGVALSTLSHGAAFAQVATPPAATSDTQVQEIVVSAQRRPELLQAVPISVQTVSGEAIARQSLTNLETLTETVPSIHISNDGAGGQAFIRGIGSGSNEIFSQSVGTFIDDIYHGSAHSSAAAFLDVERVEILKGPQSTFFGNNAIAGAINIVTVKPDTDKFSGSARALYGMFGQYVAEGAVNVPLSNTFAVRVAGNADGQNGWQTNPYAGEHQPRERNVAGRMSALWKPVEDFDVTLKIEGTSNKSQTGEAIGNCPPPAPFITSGTCATALALGLPTNGLHSTENTSGPGQGITLKTFESVLTANYHIGGHTISSVTGFIKYHSLQNLDGDATPEDLFNYQVEERYHQFSQELRLTSPTDKPLEYMAGAYFQTDHTNGAPGTLSYFFLDPTIMSTAKYAALIPYLPIAQAPSFVQDEQVYSVFGSAKWHLTDALRVNGGLRATWDSKNATLSAFNGTATSEFGGVVPFPADMAAVLNPLAAGLIGTATSASGAKTYHALMPSGGVQYDVAPAKMLYASYARGFKAGVPVTSFSSTITAPVSPEYVNAYEIGAKTEWFNHRLQINFDLFRSDYSNLQVAATVANPAGALIFGVSNAASSRSQGAELEAQVAVNRHFRLATSVSYLDSKFISYPNGTLSTTQSYCRSHPTLAGCVSLYPNGAGATQDYSGSPTTFAPKWSGSITPSYTTRLFDRFNLSTSMSAIFSTKFFVGNAAPNDLLIQQGYVRLDGRISLEFPDGRWSVDVIAKNVNNVYLYGGGNQGTGLPTSSGSLLVQREQPRNLALQARYKF